MTCIYYRVNDMGHDWTPPPRDYCDRATVAPTIQPRQPALPLPTHAKQGPAHPFVRPHSQIWQNLTDEDTVKHARASARRNTATAEYNRRAADVFARGIEEDDDGE